MIRGRAIRVYADTSVFGGAFDEEFKKASKRFFSMVQAGYFDLVTSVVVRNEILPAPEEVQSFFREILEFTELVELSREALDLQSEYLKANILTQQWFRDAQHVALATVAECAIIISWNFKHIVNFRKIPLYNAVNIALGYRPIAIHSPLEVIADEKEEV